MSAQHVPVSSKPRLRQRTFFGERVWVCGEFPLRGFGASPQNAYRQWRIAQSLARHEWKRQRQ